MWKYVIHHKDLNENLRVCMNCDYHFRMSAEDRIKLFFKTNQYNEIDLDNISDDPLNFKDKKNIKIDLKNIEKLTDKMPIYLFMEELNQKNWLWA